MKVDRRSFFAGAAALGATAPLSGLADDARGAATPSFVLANDLSRRRYDYVVVGGGFAAEYFIGRRSSSSGIPNVT